MKRFTRITALILAIALLLGTTWVTVFADGVSDFADTVNAIDKTLAYSDRLARVNSALSLYDDMSEEEKAQVTELYNTLLTEEGELEEIKRSALEYISSVNSVGEITIVDRLDVISRIEQMSVDPSYPGALEAQELLASLKKQTQGTVDACMAFLDAVTAVQLVDETDYLGLKAALNAAAAYLGSIDYNYPGISGAAGAYSSINSKLTIKEKFTGEFVSLVERMMQAETYEEKNGLLNTVSTYIDDENFLADYEGASSALDDIKLTKDYLRGCVLVATEFIIAVDSVSKANNYRVALLSCYAYLEGVDFTITDAKRAKANFDSMVDGYNEDVRICNTFMSGIE